MLTTRQELMNNILKAEQAEQIEQLFGITIKKIVENGTHPHIVKRFIQRFEGDLHYQLGQYPSEIKEHNLKEALRVLCSYETKNK